MAHQLSVPEGLSIGKSFGDYEKELEPLLHELEVKQLVPFSKFCSKYIDKYNAETGKSFPLELKYQSLTFACVHYGNKRSNAKGLRPNQSSFKSKCPARLRFTLDESTKRLTLTRLDVIHNHEIDSSSAQFYPKNRKLDKEEASNAAALMELDVKPVILQNVIRLSTHKMCTQQDLRNLKQFIKKANQPPSKNASQKDSELQLLMKELEDAMTDDPNCTIIVGHKGDEIMNVFWASSQMNSDFEIFPEVLSIDSTYNTNNANMPVTLFMNQNQHGNGRLVGVSIMRDEKQETLRTAIDHFADCYANLVDKVKTVLVDKSTNEISRIWEVMPHVDVHLCRFHVNETFKKETASDRDLRPVLNQMLYTETVQEYDKLYSRLCELSSNNPKFKAYFQKNWHSCKAKWKGHERLAGVTFGLTTTNANESIHGKIKTLLNRRTSISKCFRNIRLYHAHVNVQAAYKNFISLKKVHYVTNCSDSVVGEICNVCTPFVSSLIRQQLEWSYKMDALPAAAPIDSNKCSCGFYLSRKFPCCHMFFSRRLENLPLFNASDVPSKWRRVTSDEGNSDIDGDLDNDDNNKCNKPPPLVLIPSCPVKVGGKPLSKAEKYSKFLGLCALAGNLASLCGGNQFLQRCNVIESILHYWENNIEVDVTPISVAKETGKSFTRPETVPRPSVIVKHEPSEIKAKQPSEATSLPEDCGEDGPPCRCGVPSKRYVPKFGPNMGRICFECSRKLPQISCGFFTVEVTGGSENLDSEQQVQEDVTASNEEDQDQGSKQSGGITSINIKSSSDLRRISNLKLPVPKCIVGQPKMGVQRVLKKSIKPWTVPKHAPTFSKSSKRAQKAVNIPDADVTRISMSEWRVNSQTSSKTYKVDKLQRTSGTCLCADKVNCAHCFECECPDFIVKKAPCKHIYKVYQLNCCSELSDDSPEADAENVPRDSTECHDPPKKLDEIAVALGEDSAEAALNTLISLMDDNDSKTLSVDLYQMSEDSIVSEEDSIFNFSICTDSVEEQYICYGCSAQRVKRVSRQPKSYGREFFACPNPTTSGCRKFFWAPTREKSKTNQINQYLFEGTASTSDDTVSVLQQDYARVLAPIPAEIDKSNSFPINTSKTTFVTSPIFASKAKRARIIKRKGTSRSILSAMGNENNVGSARIKKAEDCAPLCHCGHLAKRYNPLFSTIPPSYHCAKKICEFVSPVKFEVEVPGFSLPANITVRKRKIADDDDSQTKKVNIDEKELFNITFGSIEADSHDFQLHLRQSITLTKVDLTSLRPGHWLNDKIIDAYVELCTDKNQIHVNQSDVSILRLNCLALENAAMGVTSIIDRAKVKFMMHNDLWIIPSHVNRNHWILFLVLVKRKIIVILDPMCGFVLTQDHLQHLQIVRLMIAYSNVQCLGQQPDWNEWKVCLPKDLSTQTNGIDCGVFVCMWVHSICSKSHLPEDMHHNVDTFRKQILNELVWNSSKIPKEHLPPEDANGDDYDNDVILNVYSQFDKNVKNGSYDFPRPWLDLPKPEVSELPGDISCARKLLQTFLNTLWEATDVHCGLKSKCKRTMTDMYLCVGCHEYYHLECVRDSRLIPTSQEPYLCPRHNAIKMVSVGKRNTCQPLRFRKSLS